MHPYYGLFQHTLVTVAQGEPVGERRVTIAPASHTEVEPLALLSLDLDCFVPPRSCCELEMLGRTCDSPPPPPWLPPLALLRVLPALPCAASAAEHDESPPCSSRSRLRGWQKGRLVSDCLGLICHRTQCITGRAKSITKEQMACGGKCDARERLWLCLLSAYPCRNGSAKSVTQRSWGTGLCTTGVHHRVHRDFGGGSRTLQATQKGLRASPVRARAALTGLV